MSYTDQEIADLTGKLATAGAPTADIESFVKSAKEAQSLNPPSSMALRPDQQAAQAQDPSLPANLNASMLRVAGTNMAAGATASPGINGKVLDAGLEAGGATLGQAAGAATGPFAPVAVPALGALGAIGGNALAQGRRILTGEQDKPNWGQLGAAGVSGSIPGVTMGKGLFPIAKAATVYGLGNVAAKTIETGINQGQLPTQAQALTAFAGGIPGAVAQKVLGNVIPGALSDAQKLNLVRDSRFRDLRPEGVNVTPHEMGVGSDIVSSTGGKAATQQAVSDSNVKVWQRMAREDLGMSAEALPFKEGDVVSGVKSDFDKVREKAYQPYEELAAISPKTEKDLDLLRQQNRSVQDAFQAFKEAKISRDQYEVIRNTRDTLQTALENKAQSVGRPDLVPQMLEAKKRIAMSYAYENATNTGSGFVHPDALASQLSAGVPLTDNAKRMALFAQAFPKSSVVQGPAPGVNALTPMAAGQAAAQGTPSGYLAGAYQLAAGPIARKYQLSNFAQTRYAGLPSATEESIPSALVRFAAEQQGRNK